MPGVSARFFAFGATGAVPQILATLCVAPLCVVALFGERNFAVGIACKKTEGAKSAIVGYLGLGAGLSRGG